MMLIKYLHYFYSDMSGPWVVQKYVKNAHRNGSSPREVVIFRAA